MSITDQQRRALAYLGRTGRDTVPRAERFDEPGLMAALGKVRHLDVFTVGMAVLRCAADPSLNSPGLIGDPSSRVYRERLGPELARRHTRPAEACTHCGGLYGPLCCDQPTQRPEPVGDYTAGVKAARDAKAPPDQGEPFGDVAHPAGW